VPPHPPRSRALRPVSRARRLLIVFTGALVVALGLAIVPHMTPALAANEITLGTGHDRLIGGVDYTRTIDHNQFDPTSDPRGSLEHCIFLRGVPPTGTGVRTTNWSITAVSATTNPAQFANFARIDASALHGTATATRPDPFVAGGSPFDGYVCVTNIPAGTHPEYHGYTFTVHVETTGNTASQPLLTGDITLREVDYHTYPGRDVGDVHAMSFDENVFDFQGAGEYVLAEGRPGDGFTVQGRFETVANRQVSVTTALAFHVGGDTLAAYVVEAGGGTGSTTTTVDAPAARVVWLLNGELLTVDGIVALPDGGTVRTTADGWRIEWPAVDADEAPHPAAGTAADVTFWPNWVRPMLNIDRLDLGPELYGNDRVHGLLGSPDRDPGNDFTPADAEGPIDPTCREGTPAYQQPLYAAFGASWLVDRETSLFSYRFEGEGPGTYHEPEFPATCTPPPLISVGVAEAICRYAGVTVFPDLQWCTTDVSAAGDQRIADHYAGLPQPPPGTGGTTTTTTTTTTSTTTRCPPGARDHGHPLQRLWWLLRCLFHVPR
jgi:hypothetical protein